MRKFAIKERASIRALSSLISAQTVGNPLSAARRSYSSMLLLDFGRLTKRPSRKRDYLVGEWTLLVEWSDWTMTVPGRGQVTSNVTSNSEYDSIDKMLPALVRQPVTQLSFTPNERLMLRLRNGAELSCAGTGGPRRGSRLASWTLSSAAHWNVQFRCHLAFVVEAEYGTPPLRRFGTSSRDVVAMATRPVIRISRFAYNVDQLNRSRSPLNRSAIGITISEPNEASPRST